MDTGVFRNRGQDRQASTYWRRRFVALVIGLAILALFAWALSGALRSSLAVRGAADGGSRGGQQDHQQAGQAGHGAGGSGPALAPVRTASSSAPPSAPAAGGAKDRARARGRPAPARSVPGPRSAGGPGRVPRPCRPADVVLSLSSGQASFGPRQMPVFDLDIVSTSAGTCTFNAGAKYLTLVVKSGRTRIWASGDCVQGEGSLVSDLTRGVPTVVPISWDRETSSPGCQVGARHVPAGAYSATAVAGADTSPTETFRLR
jgi:hypothetical protein